MDEYIFLTEAEYMWSEMLMDILRENNIPCFSKRINPKMRIYIFPGDKDRAEELVKDFLSDDI